MSRCRRDRIPTYQEVLDIVAGTGVGLLLDIKDSPQLDRSELIRLTHEAGAASNVIVGVRNTVDLQTFRKHSPALRTLGFVATVDDMDSFVDAGVDIIRLFPEWIRADPDLVRHVQRRGKPVWVTAGDASLDELMALVTLGVDGLLSDSPALMQPLLAFLLRSGRGS